MGVSPVPGYGEITKSNAAQIYRDKETYNQLDVAQKHMIDHFVSPEEKDEIDYDSGAYKDNARQNGKDSVQGSKEAEEGGAQTGNAIATSIGGAIFAAGAAILAKICPTMSKTTAWTALGLSAASLACSIGTVACANAYDDAYDNRCKARDNAGSTNEYIDANTAAMENTMEMMNEDMEVYQAQNDEMTNGMNEKAAQMADLKQQLADCEALGDKAGAAGIKNQMKKMEGENFDEDQEGLDETRDKLEGYQEANAEAIGVADGGATVAEFLGYGTGLGVGAYINALLLTVAGVYTGAAVASAAGSAKTLIQIPVAAIAAAVFGVSVGLLGTSANTMRTKGNNEFECGSAGSEMDGHVNNLNTMIEQQQQYIDTTGENYDTSDEEAGEDREKGQQAADALSPGGTKNPNGADKDKDKDKDNNNNSGTVPIP